MSKWTGRGKIKLQMFDKVVFSMVILAYTVICIAVILKSCGVWSGL